VHHEHLADEKESILASMKKWIERFQVIIFSGGTSMGKYDYVPEVLRELSFKEVFYKVKQRPGKPMWFGHLNREIFVFALPGNPVSAFLCLLRYIIPWLQHSAGIKPDEQKGILAADFFFKPELTYFLQVDARIDRHGRYFAQPRIGHGSGDLANLVGVNAFMELPEDREQFKKGELYPLHLFR